MCRKLSVVINAECCCRYTILESIKIGGEWLAKVDPGTNQKWQPSQWAEEKGLEIEAFCTTMCVVGASCSLRSVSVQSVLHRPTSRPR
jgi:hypothetical protein